ncbi:hypothetical protein PIB30_068245 [Stylosanthes scabra]|uniref:Ubiquitin-like domain-containing protein n=1 Tax=Stylosanthes scabra TaxID=79078 RepID=A0ABU6TMK1_9FABA|nr:hypothetical protein [Stylosanthes scabra]
MSSTKVEPMPLFMEVDLKGTVMQLKENLQTLLSIPLAKQSLLFNVVILHDDQVLESCGIVEHSRLHLGFTLESESAYVVYAQMLVEVRGGSSGTSDAATQTFSVLVSSTSISSFKFSMLVTAEDMFPKLREKVKNFGEYFAQVTAEGCHYVHDDRILDPDRPMAWHQIESGDKIEIIPRATD